MKRIMMVLACAGACLSLGGCAWLSEIQAIAIEEIDVTALRSGTYEARQDNTMVTAKVSVTVADGRITGIKLLEHQHGPNHGADAIIDRVIEKQSLQVDAVSGSTYSSKVVLKAIESALKKGL